MATNSKLPSRLHHTAYVTKDLEATRAFYEDVIGLLAALVLWGVSLGLTWQAALGVVIFANVVAAGYGK